jgi:hypothetical protein
VFSTRATQPLTADVLESSDAWSIGVSSLDAANTQTKQQTVLHIEPALRLCRRKGMVQVTTRALVLADVNLQLLLPASV